MFLFRQGTICFFYVYQPTAPLISVLGPPTDNPGHPLNFSKHRRDILTLSGAEIDRKVRSQEVELTQDMGPVLKVLVSPYVPLPRDKTAYKWSSRGVTHRLEMPLYLIDTPKLLRQVCLHTRKKQDLVIFKSFWIAQMNYFGTPSASHCDQK